MPETKTSASKKRFGKDASVAGRSPLFVQKVRTENPGKEIEIWFQDEVRIGQQGILANVWAPKGTRPIAVKQTEYDWVYIFGAVNPVNGKSSALTRLSHLGCKIEKIKNIFGLHELWQAIVL